MIAPPSGTTPAPGTADPARLPEPSAVAEALRRSEQRYRSLVAATALIVWTTDAEGAIVEDSPTWRATTGQTFAEFRGWGWLDALHPDDRIASEQAWERSVAAQEQYVQQYRIRRVDGTYRLVEARGVPIVEHGVLKEWVGTCTDVTDAAEAAAARDELVRRVQVAADRTRRLQRVTSALSRALTVADVGAVVLEHGAAELGATGCGMALVDEAAGELRMLALTGYAAELLTDWATGPLSEDDYITVAAVTGQAVFVNDKDELLARFSSVRLHRGIAVSGNHAWCALPLITTGAPLGALSFGFPTAREFSADERTFLVALASQCAQAVNRAQLYERQRSTALMLQQSLLPPELPARPGLSVTARYRPATLDVEVGGDWYDVVPLRDGRTAIVLGDVMGKGVPAATVMGQVRNVLRGYAFLDPSPSQVLSRLDLLFEVFELEQITTVVYGVYDPVSRVLTWSSAGHLPALVVSDGEATYLDDPGTPLGVPGERCEHQVVLAPGAVVLLCSDGLVERRAESLSVGLELLRGAALGLLTGSVDLETVADGVLAALLPDGSHADDVTMLLLRTDAGPGEP